MTSLWFVVPAHGREEITRVCLGELAAVCEFLTGFGIDATAVVIADDGNLDAAKDLGFWGIERDNAALGRKFNDGYQLAAEKGADFVVPFGSDDWIDPAWIISSPLDDRVMRCARRFASVNETGRHLAHLNVQTSGGCGIRIIPTRLLERFRYRPAVEDRARGIDGTTLVRMRRALGNDLVLHYVDLHPLQIVDWKTDGPQLTPYETVRIHQIGEEEDDPFGLLASAYPVESLERMRAAYEAVAA